MLKVFRPVAAAFRSKGGCTVEPIVTVQMLIGALTKVLDAASGEVGRQGWSALTEIVKRWRHRSSDSGGEALPVPTTPSDVAGLNEFAEALAAGAAADPAFAAELAGWHKMVVSIVTGSGDVSNAISGSVHGAAVQARDIAGPITFN